MKLTNGQLAKAKAAKNAKELLALAKENGTELTDDEAKKYFAELHKEGELADDELDNVSGGGCGEDPPDPHEVHIAALSAGIPNTDNHNQCPVCGAIDGWVFQGDATGKTGLEVIKFWHCNIGDVDLKSSRNLSASKWTWHLR